jgi:hypothetical protein
VTVYLPCNFQGWQPGILPSCRTGRCRVLDTNGVSWLTQLCPVHGKDVPDRPVPELSELRADYTGRLDRYPKDNPRGATARAVY